MKIKVGISNKHVHLNEFALNELFGCDLTKLKDLSQTGQYACNETVTIKTKKNEIKNVRILGPLREKVQVELAMTDAYYLGINPPVRNSGDLDNSETVTLIGPKGEITVENSTIIATRHVHITKTDREKYNFYKDMCSIKINSLKGGIIENVHVKEDDSFVFELHLDTDDANAFLLKNGDEVEIIGE